MAKIKAKVTKLLNIKRRYIYALVIILLAIALLPNLDELTEGISAIGQADLKWIIIAIGGLAGTYLATAWVYVTLAKRLQYFKTVIVQLATAFTNRLLPGGFGGLGLNVDYLIKNGYQATSAASVAIVNSIVAFISHIILLILAFSLSHKSVSSLWAGKQLPIGWVIIVILVIVLIILVCIKIWQRRILRALEAVIVKTAAYWHRPKDLVLATTGATFVTLFFVLALWACAQAMGMDVNFVQTFVVYTTGVIITMAMPTPGGLGGMEAGLVAGMVAYGQSSSLAFSAVIIYRLITFWTPIIPGYLCFWWFRRRRVV